MVDVEQGSKAVEKIRLEKARNHAGQQMSTRGHAISQRLRVEHLMGKGKR